MTTHHLRLHSDRHRRIRIRISGVVLAGAAALSVGACSSDGGITSTTATSSKSVVALDHNDADVTFSRGMIPHHRQAVEMAELAPTRAQDPRVTELAAQVAAAQTPEIDELSSRLRSWGEPVPGESSMDHGSMGHGDATDSSMSGMMSAGDMSALAALRATPFDRKWLSMMIEHHTGAVAMAKTELANGTNQASKTLAQRIIATQESEISRMKALLAG